jgi:hypothetical protein
MQERKINLNRIINNHIDTSKMNKYDKQAIVNGFMMFGEQLLELASENAKIHYTYDDLGVGGYQCDKQSITNTIKQIEL